MAFLATFLNEKSTAEQRLRSPGNRVRLVGPKMKGGLMYGAALDSAILAPLPGWEDAAKRKTASAYTTSREKKHIPRQRKTRSSPGKLRGSYRSLGRQHDDRRRMYASPKQKSKTIQRGRDNSSVTASAHGESAALPADFDNISDVIGTSSYTTGSVGSFDQQSMSSHSKASSAIDCSGQSSDCSSSSKSPKHTSSDFSDSSPISSSSTDTPQRSRNKLKIFDDTAAGSIDKPKNRTAGYLRDTNSSSRKKTVRGNSGAKHVRSVRISRRGSIRINTSKSGTTYRRRKHKRSNASKVKKKSSARKMNRLEKKQYASEPSPTRPVQRKQNGKQRSSPVDEIVESIERKLKSKQIGTFVKALKQGQSQEHQQPKVNPNLTATASSEGTLKASRRPWTKTKKVDSSSRRQQPTTHLHHTSLESSRTRPLQQVQIEEKRPLNVTNRIGHGEGHRKCVTGEAKHVSFKDQKSISVRTERLRRSQVGLPKQYTNSNDSSFHSSSQLDHGLKEERMMQQQSLHDFWSERKQNIAKVDSVLYGQIASKHSGIEHMSFAAPIDTKSVGQPGQSLSKKAKMIVESPVSVRSHLRSYADSLERDNAISDLKDKNSALAAKIASQEEEMSRIQEEMCLVREKSLTSSAELRDLKRRQLEREHNAKLHATEEAAKMVEVAAEMEERTAKRLEMIEETQRALSAQQAQKKRIRNGAKRATSYAHDLAPARIHTSIENSIENIVAPERVYDVVVRWMSWTQESVMNQISDSMGITKDEILSSKAGSSTLTAPFPAFFNQLLCESENAIEPAARRFCSTFASILSLLSMREKSRQSQFQSVVQKSRLTVTKARSSLEAESKRELEKLSQTHQKNMDELKNKAANAVQAAAKERDEAVEDAKVRILQAQQEANESYRRGREEGDYELKRQKERQAEETKQHQSKINELSETIEILESRVKELENEAQPETLANAMQRISELEEALEEASDETRQTREALGQCEEDCEDRVARARAEHDRRLLAMRNAHEERLTIIQSKMTQLSSEHTSLLQRVKSEAARREKQIEARVRREAERAALTAGLEIRGEMEGKLNRAKSKYRIEVQRLRRMLERVSRLEVDRDSISDGENSQGDNAGDSVIELFDNTDEERRESFFTVDTTLDDSIEIASANGNPSQRSLPDKVSIGEEQHAAQLGLARAILQAQPGLPGLERSGVDLINQSGLTSADSTGESKMSTPTHSPKSAQLQDDKMNNTISLNPPSMTDTSSGMAEVEQPPSSQPVPQPTFPGINLSQAQGASEMKLDRNASYKSQLEAYIEEQENNE